MTSALALVIACVAFGFALKAWSVARGVEQDGKAIDAAVVRLIADQQRQRELAKAADHIRRFPLPGPMRLTKQ